MAATRYPRGGTSRRISAPRFVSVHFDPLSMPNSLLPALRAFYRSIKQELWFRPVIWILATALVALPLLALSTLIDEAAIPAFLRFEAEAMRELLRFLATSMLTVTTVSFSVIVVVMTVAAGQITPRAIPGILRDPAIQDALGVFITGFVFGLVGLIGFSQVSGAPGTVFVATVISATFAGLAVIYFIRLVHHVSQRIQVTQVLAQQRDLGLAAIAHFFDRPPPGAENRDRGEDPPNDKPAAIVSAHSGYVQLLHLEGLFDEAERSDLVLRTAATEGLYVARGSPLLDVWSKSELSEQTRGTLLGAVRIGVLRTPEGDPLFPLEVMGEIGERALSPGVNDTSTALAALDHLWDCFCRWADYEPPSGRVVGKGGRLRVVTQPPALALALTCTLGRIGRSGKDNVEILARIQGIVADLRKRPGFTRDCEDVVQVLLPAEARRD
ncbi:MAG: DUF2254 domain-containing protein [Kiloniellales bacterium]